MIVTKKVVEVQISGAKLKKVLGIVVPHDQHDRRTNVIHDLNGHCEEDRESHPDVITIAVTSHLLRCGKQVKLVLGHGPDQPWEANPQLVEIITKTRRWYEGLTSGRYPTLRSIAVQENCDKSYVSRLLSLAFLAPDIVERILTGHHAATLTPERLRKACPLPARWEEQRAMLLD